MKSYTKEGKPPPEKLGPFAVVSCPEAKNREHCYCNPTCTMPRPDMAGVYYSERSCCWCGKARMFESYDRPGKDPKHGRFQQSDRSKPE